ncbi:hypothetical protein [Desulforamulus putei]|nr:hypothetical protein [Desulforamulus putei]
MTKAELKKVLVVEKVVARQVKVTEAATLLGLCAPGIGHYL